MLFFVPENSLFMDFFYKFVDFKAHESACMSCWFSEKQKS